MIITMNMINRIKISAFVLLFAAGSGQAQTLKGDVNTENYPEISFVWNEYNPEMLDSAQFALNDGGGSIPFSVQVEVPADSVLNAKPKSILFLWEDLDSKTHAGQSKFTQATLGAFLKNVKPAENDRFNTGVFDRKGGNDLGSSIHTFLSDGFTADCNALADKLLNFKHKYDFFSAQDNSELYIAIEEGIALLSKESPDRLRAIVVFTAGSNQDSYGGRNGIDENRALSLKIPVYVVKFPIKGCEHCSNIDLVCKNTYGLEIATADTATATTLLTEAYGKMAARHYGQDYRIEFITTAPRDGKQHTFTLSVGGKERQLSFTAPAITPKLWIKEHLWLSAAVAAGILLLILSVVLTALARARKHRETIQDLKEQQQTAQDRANKTQADFADFVKQSEKVKRNELELAFEQMMQSKNYLPCLKYEFFGENRTFFIEKHDIAIGRDPDNDLVLQYQTVSRHHARLFFNGASFEIHDLGSANKLIVNGAFVQRAPLRNGDIIGLGEAVLKFYH
jgi:hypothetical protein